MTKVQIERAIKSVKRSMEIEGFEIDSALEERGRKLLTGELDLDSYLKEYIANIGGNDA